MTAPHERKYWIAFNRIPGIGRVRCSLLLNHFGSLERAWLAEAADLRAAGLEPRLAQHIVAQRPQIDVDGEAQRLRAHGVQALTWDDAAYPARLKEIYDPPPVLYVRGELTEADEWAVAVVGTRRPTPAPWPPG